MTKTKDLKPKRATPVLDEQTVKVLAHPLRHQLLVALNEGVASPKELSQRLGQPLGNVSYHVRVLAEHGCIELVRTTPRRGAVEHHYRAIRRPYFSDDYLSDLPLHTRQDLAGRILQRLLGDVVDAANGSGFDRPDVHISWTPLELDDQGYQDVTDLLAETLERVLEIQAESTSRTADGGEVPSIRTQVSMLHHVRG